MTKVKIEYKNSIKAKFYCSDANPSYQNVSYSWHIFTSATNRIHSQPKVSMLTSASTFALQREFKCFFCSLETLKAVVRVFVYTYNKFGEFKQRFYCLKSAIELTSFCLVFNLCTPPSSET